MVERVLEVVVWGEGSGRGRSGNEVLKRIMRVIDGVDEVIASITRGLWLHRLH